MLAIVQTYRHIGIVEVPRGEALALIRALEVHGASVATIGWGCMCWCEGEDGEVVRVVVSADPAQLAVVRWDAPLDGGRRVELEMDEVMEAPPVSRGSNGGREMATALLARIGVRG
jgi:hypothetical protein